MTGGEIKSSGKPQKHTCPTRESKEYSFSFALQNLYLTTQHCRTQTINLIGNIDYIKEHAGVVPALHDHPYHD